DNKALDLALAAGLETACQDLDMPIGQKIGLDMKLGEAPREEKVEIGSKGRVILGKRQGGHAEASRPRRRISSPITRSSAAPNSAAGLSAARASPAWTSASRSCIERASPEAARLTNCLTAASTLVMRLRRPCSVTTIRSPRVAATTEAKLRAPFGRPRGLPERPGGKRCSRGGRP